MKHNIYIIIHTLLLVFFAVLTLCIGRTMYLLYAVLCLVFILYFIRLKKKDIKGVGRFIASIVALVFAFPVFYLISGMVSYRPNHCYYFYKNSLLKENEVFDDISLFDLKLSNFYVFMEGQRGQEIVLSYTAPDTKEVEAYYSKNSIATGTATDPAIYNGMRYYFSFNKYLKSEEKEYRIYYTELQDEHQSGVAVNSKEKIVTFFDT